MGFAVVVFESVLSSATLHRPYDTPILGRLAGIMVWVMLGFMVVRYGDVIRLGALPLAFQPGVQAVSFWIEFLAGVAAVLLLLPASARANPRYLFLGAFGMLINGFLYRLNCYLIGYDPGNGWHYFPSVGEIVVTLGIFALHFLLYLAFVKQLPVLHAVKAGGRV
jgi:Ni/Fe-hydrogenase subunit HybB-like protein